MLCWVLMCVCVCASRAVCTVCTILDTKLRACVDIYTDTCMWVLLPRKFPTSNIEIFQFSFQVFIIIHVSNLYSNFVIRQNFHKMCYVFLLLLEWSLNERAGSNIANVYGLKRWLIYDTRVWMYERECVYVCGFWLM